MSVKWPVFFILLLMLTGCKADLIDQSSNEEIIEVDTTPIVVSSEWGLSEKDEISKWFEYLETHMSTMTQEECSLFFYQLEEVSVRNQFHYVELIAADEHFQDDLMKCYDLTTKDFDVSLFDGKSKPLIEELYSNGYKLMPYEGVIYPITDYSRFKAYSAFMGEEAKSYVYLKALESEEYTNSRTELEISKEDLVERILLSEQHLKKFPQERTYKMVAEMYKAYMYYYIPATIIYQEELNFSEAIIKEYEGFVDAYPETLSAQIVTDYLNVLKANNYEKSEQLNKYIDEFYDELNTYLTLLN